MIKKEFIMPVAALLASTLMAASAFAQQNSAESDYGNEAEARAMLVEVVAAVQADKNKALDMFTRGEGGFLDRDLYPFCINVSDGTIVAQGGPLSARYLGQDIRPLKDAAGAAYGSEIFAAAQKPEGEITEVRYMFPKPIAGSPPVPKVSYVTRIGDIGCGVGHYAVQLVTREEAVSMVQEAVAAIKAVGPQEAYREIDNPSGTFVDRELYIVVFRLDGTILAHGADTSRVGRNMINETDADGTFFNRERVELAQEHSAFWHEYKFTNPITNQVEPKNMYCERLDDTVVCGGIYQASTE